MYVYVEFVDWPFWSIDCVASKQYFKIGYHSFPLDFKRRCFNSAKFKSVLDLIDSKRINYIFGIIICHNNNRSSDIDAWFEDFYERRNIVNFTSINDNVRRFKHADFSILIILEILRFVSPFKSHSGYCIYI